MSAALLQRLTALESTAKASEEFRVIHLVIVSPGQPTGEAVCARLAHEGIEFTREPSETEAQFLERVDAYARSIRRPGQQGATVILDDKSPRKGQP